MEGSPRYRFSEPRDGRGRTLPHRHQHVERWEPDLQHPDGGVWERVGYVEIHLHRVKVDETDIEDISVGLTVRINPKV